jgi:hypothetical protein
MPEDTAAVDLLSQLHQSRFELPGILDPENMDIPLILQPFEQHVQQHRLANSRITSHHHMPPLQCQFPKLRQLFFPSNHNRLILLPRTAQSIILSISSADFDLAFPTPDSQTLASNLECGSLLPL